jgi:hypothetical protein
MKPTKITLEFTGFHGYFPVKSHDFPVRSSTGSAIFIRRWNNWRTSYGPKGAWPQSPVVEKVGRSGRSG